MDIDLKTNSIEDYRKFLAIKALPRFSFTGRTASFPDEYASIIGLKKTRRRTSKYTPIEEAFDYQAGVTEIAIEKRKFAAFMACGMGKTLVMSEYVRHVREHIPKSKSILIVSPSMVIPQTIGEFHRFYGDRLPVNRIRANALGNWLTNGRGIGITNYEAITDELPDSTNIAALVLDESSLLKSHYGKWGTRLIQMGKGLEWKLCLTGTPAPNDRIEYANHAVFLDQFPTVNAFLARFFVNRGQTDNRWELKAHALKPFYRALSHWCIFLSNPAVYGWKDNTDELPPINVHIHDVELTEQQHDAARMESKALFATAGGITSRAKLAQIAKGSYNGEKIDSLKPEFIANMLKEWPDESTLIWCRFNAEQEALAETIPEAASISGDTPEEERMILLDWFKREICDCEKEKMLKCLRQKRNTCGDITKPTNTVGMFAAESSETSTTNGGEKSTQPAKKSKQKRELPLRNGSKKIRKADSLNGSSHTESHQNNSTPYEMHKADSAPSVEPTSSTREPADCTSTIAILPGKSVDCFASTAITQSESLETTQNYSTKLPHICVCTEQQLKRGRVMISKPKVLGFGLNLQICSRMIFSTLQDSYEEYHQALKRANRYGSKRALNVHIPLTDIERPMVDTVLRKARMTEEDTRQQEIMFREFIDV